MQTGANFAAEEHHRKNKLREESEKTKQNGPQCGLWVLQLCLKLFETPLRLYYI